MRITTYVLYLMVSHALPSFISILTTCLTPLATSHLAKANDFTQSDPYQKALELWNSLEKHFPSRPPSLANDFDDLYRLGMEKLLRLGDRPNSITAYFFQMTYPRDIFLNEFSSEYLDSWNEIKTLLSHSYKEFNNSEALNKLAELYMYPKENSYSGLSQVFHHYKVSSEDFGNAFAHAMLGILYSTGLNEHHQPDLSLSLLHHEIAARQNITLSQMALAYKYLKGIGVPKSCPNALLHYQNVSQKAIDHYFSGPPGGRYLPKGKKRLPDIEGGLFGVNSDYSGRPDPRKFDDILLYYKYKSERGDILSKLQLAQYYYLGTTKPDYDLAFTHFSDIYSSAFSSSLIDQELTECGAQAAGYLGLMYWRGEGVKASTSKALEFFRKGASHNDAISLNSIGLMMMEITKDNDAAVEFFQKAVEQNSVDAKVNLARIYLYDRKDVKKALIYLQQAAKSGHFLAHYYLGEIYRLGLGVSKSCSVAVKNYKIFAEKADWLFSPIEQASEALDNGNIIKSLFYFMTAAEMGYEVGLSSAAWLLEQPFTTYQVLFPRNNHLQLAFRYWLRASTNGNRDARIRLGDHYFYGLGVESNAEKAASIYHVAADLDHHPVGFWNLGWMYENGIGVPRDLHLAKRYYDHSLLMNEDGSLAVRLSLLRLYLKYFRNYLHGEDVHPSLFFAVNPDENVEIDIPIDEEVFEGGSEESQNEPGHLLFDDSATIFGANFEDVLLILLTLLTFYLLFLRNIRNRNPANRGEQENPEDPQAWPWARQ